MNRPVSPTTFVPMTRTMRQLIENVVEDLLLLLDEIDGDADLEDESEDDDSDLEPILGANICFDQSDWHCGIRDDREIADDSEEGDDELERDDSDYG
jgi:hypothetical protein